MIVRWCLVVDDDLRVSISLPAGPPTRRSYYAVVIIGDVNP